MLKRTTLLAAIIVTTGCFGDGCFGDDDHHDDDTETIPDRLIVTGSLTTVNPTRGASPLASGTIVARVDTDGNGIFDDGDTIAVNASGDTYRVEVPMERRRRVSMLLRADTGGTGVAEVIGGPDERVVADLSVPAITSLGCELGNCVGGDVKITGLEDDYEASAISLSPIASRNLFPGSWGTDDGALLESGGFMFGSIEAADGSSVYDLDSPAVLTFELPVESWKELRDIDPGNGAIDVPFYAFDDVKGTWVRDGQAVLVDAIGETILESELDAIRGGTFAGTVSARGDVSHFSFWNVDFPLDQVSAVEIELDFDEESPLSPVVHVDGLTYDGGGVINPGSTVDDQNVFCIALRRSEPAGTDDDDNGEAGEAHRSRLRIRRGEKNYVVEIDHPEEVTSCDDPVALGVLPVTEESVRETEICEIEGRVVDLAGTALPGIIVRAYDPTLTQQEAEETCDGGCDDVIQSEADGGFTYRTAFGSTLGISALAVTPAGSRSGKLILDECPTEPVEVILNSGYSFTSLDITVSDDSIEWTPDVPVGSISVGRDGQALWQVLWDESRFPGPVTYGTVPAGAVQSIPESGEPMGLQSGDFIRILGIGPGDPYPIQYEGLYTVP